MMPAKEFMMRRKKTKSFVEIDRWLMHNPGCVKSLNFMKQI